MTQQSGLGVPVNDGAPRCEDQVWSGEAGLVWGWLREACQGRAAGEAGGWVPHLCRSLVLSTPWPEENTRCIENSAPFFDPSRTVPFTALLQGGLTCARAVAARAPLGLSTEGECFQKAGTPSFSEFGTRGFPGPGGPHWSGRGGSGLPGR